MNHKRLPLMPCLALAWLCAIPLACFVGPVYISLSDMTHIYLHKAGFTQLNMETKEIIINLRLARACLALLCGGALAIAGVILQACLRNSLADPFTLGISAGAAFGASLALVFPFQLNFTGLQAGNFTALCAMAGSFMALGASLLIGRAASTGGRESIILAGIAVASFLGAIVALIKSLNEESVTSIVFWLLGSLQGRSWTSLAPVLICLIPGLAIILPNWRKLDAFLLGDEQAWSLGINPVRMRLLFLLGASCITAGCVAACGIIAFAGLVVPHLVRLAIGSLHGPLLFCSFFGGGIFLLGADCLARTVLPSGPELPVGVVTALLGAPFFGFLVWRHK